MGLRPFLLPLFTGVRGIGILRTSPFGDSRKFRTAPVLCGSFTQYGECDFSRMFFCTPFSVNNTIKQLAEEDKG